MAQMTIVVTKTREPLILELEPSVSSISAREEETRAERFIQVHRHLRPNELGDPHHLGRS